MSFERDFFNTLSMFDDAIRLLLEGGFLRRPTAVKGSSAGTACFAANGYCLINAVTYRIGLTVTSIQVTSPARITMPMMIE